MDTQVTGKAEETPLENKAQVYDVLEQAQGFLETLSQVCQEHVALARSTRFTEAAALRAREFRTRRDLDKLMSLLRGKTVSCPDELPPDELDLIPFLTALAHPDDDISMNAATVLTWLDVVAFPALLTAVDTPDPVLRLRIAIVLGDSNNHQAITPLIGLLNDADQRVRSASALALGRLGDVRAGDALIQALLKYYPASSEAILKAIALLGKANPALRALGMLGSVKSCRALAKALIADTDALSATAAHTLGQLGQPGIEVLLGALKSEIVKVRSLAVEEIEKAGLEKRAGEGVLEPLLHLLHHDAVTAIRLKAARALGAIGDRRAVPHLQRVVLEGGEVGEEAWRALERIAQLAKRR